MKIGEGKLVPGSATLAIHASEPDRVSGGALSRDLALSTSFHVGPGAAFSASDVEGALPPFYGRWGNPSVAALEHTLAVLEGGEAAICFSSGMAAISGLLFSSLKAGDHAIIQNVCYAGVAELFHDIVAQLGISFDAVDPSDPANVERALKPETKLVLIETPTNPILRLADIAAIARITRGSGIKLAVDSTIATPVATRPLWLGADLVIHSLTKYLGGHGDALGGAIVGKSEDIIEIRRRSLVHLGAVLHPFAAWTIERGLQTLKPRMERHEANALLVAKFLDGHPRVTRVIYPGLKSHPQYELARHQMDCFSGLLAFQVRDPEALRVAFATELNVVSHAVSLGKTKSLIFYVDTDEMLRVFKLHGQDADQYVAWAGSGLFRLSVGLEDAADIIADLEAVLGKSAPRKHE